MDIPGVPSHMTWLSERFGAQVALEGLLLLMLQVVHREVSAVQKPSVAGGAVWAEKQALVVGFVGVHLFTDWCL